MSKTAQTGLDPFSTSTSTGTYEHGAIDIDYSKAHSRETSEPSIRPGLVVSASLGTYEHGTIDIDTVLTCSKASNRSLSRPGIAVGATLGYRGVTGHSKVVKCNVLRYIGYNGYQPLSHEGIQADGYQFGTVSKTPSYMDIAIVPTHHEVVLVKKVLEGVQFSVGEKITVYQPRIAPLQWSPGVWNGQGK